MLSEFQKSVAPGQVIWWKEGGEFSGIYSVQEVRKEPQDELTPDTQIVIKNDPGVQVEVPLQMIASPKEASLSELLAYFKDEVNAGRLSCAA